MINQVFIGGHFSSGTRVVQFLLKQFYDIATDQQEEGSYHDYEDGFSKRPTFGEKVLSGGNPPFSGTLPEKFSVKNPEFMFCFPYLKKLFPDSKTILVVRNGLDQILCENRCMSEKLASYFDLQESDYFRREMEFWNNIYKKAVTNGSIDLVVKLEDLVQDTKFTVKKIMNLLGLKQYPDTSMIRVPDSMSVFNIHHTITLPANAAVGRMQEESHVYNPSRRKELYEVGKQMMDYFGYENI